MRHDLAAEEQLIHRLMVGEAGALREFYREQAPRLLKWLSSRVKNDEDAQELVHDTFLHLIDSLPVFRSRSSLTTYLYGIAKHEVADYWRKKYAKKAILTVPLVDQIYTERVYSAKKTAARVEQAYRQLLPQERWMLVWKYEEARSVAEIARRLGISLKAAESRLFRARLAFQKAYGD